MRAFFTVLGFFSFACSALAQQPLQIAGAAPGITGEWYGIIENYPNNDPRRKLVIYGSTCTWDEVSKSNGAPTKQCLVTTDSATIITIADSTVALRSTGVSLRGTFTLRSGKQMTISMFRSPAEARDWAAYTVPNPFDPGQLRIMPQLSDISRPQLTVEEVHDRCVKYFGNGTWVRYTGNIAVAGLYVKRLDAFFATDGTVLGSYMKDGRPVCLLRYRIDAASWGNEPSYGKEGAKLSFDGVRTYWSWLPHGRHEGMMYTVLPNGDLYLTRFYREHWRDGDRLDPNDVKRTTGKLVRE